MSAFVLYDTVVVAAIDRRLGLVAAAYGETNAGPLSDLGDPGRFGQHAIGPLGQVVHHEGLHQPGGSRAKVRAQQPDHPLEFLEQDARLPLGNVGLDHEVPRANEPRGDGVVRQVPVLEFELVVELLLGRRVGGHRDLQLADQLVPRIQAGNHGLVDRRPRRGSAVVGGLESHLHVRGHGHRENSLTDKVVARHLDQQAILGNAGELANHLTSNEIVKTVGLATGVDPFGLIFR